jgi:hypothetical protein
VSGGGPGTEQFCAWALPLLWRAGNIQPDGLRLACWRQENAGILDTKGEGQIIELTLQSTVIFGFGEAYGVTSDAGDRRGYR